MKASPGERRKLQRQRRELGKLYNLVVYIIASGKRTDLFLVLQVNINIGRIEGKRQKLLLDGGMRWNAIYLMITRVLYLREALDLYANKLRGSIEELD